MTLGPTLKELISWEEKAPRLIAFHELCTCSQRRMKQHGMSARTPMLLNDTEKARQLVPLCLHTNQHSRVFAMVLPCRHLTLIIS